MTPEQIVLLLFGSEVHKRVSSTLSLCSSRNYRTIEKLDRFSCENKDGLELRILRQKRFHPIVLSTCLVSNVNSMCQQILWLCNCAFCYVLSLFCCLRHFSSRQSVNLNVVNNKKGIIFSTLALRYFQQNCESQ